MATAAQTTAQARSAIMSRALALICSKLVRGAAMAAL
jgi:hypothetical protein